MQIPPGINGYFESKIENIRNSFLLIDTGVETTGELETLILDRMVWRKVILDPRAAPADPP